jgi:ribosome maturation factor RimP
VGGVLAQRFALARAYPIRIVENSPYICVTKEEWAARPFFIGTRFRQLHLNPLPDHIRAVLDEISQKTDVSIIDVHVRGQHSQLVLEIFIDSVNGVTHDECRDITHAIEERLDGDEWFGRLRTIDVSSPGADAPVRHLWQLAKSIGRTVRVTRTDGTAVEGPLVAVADDGLTLTVTEGKGKAKTVSDVAIAAADINEARVIISFR